MRQYATFIFQHIYFKTLLIYYPNLRKTSNYSLIPHSRYTFIYFSGDATQPQFTQFRSTLCTPPT